MKHIGVSYKQTKLRDDWDAIVIGSGIGGLATAALLSKRAGKRVLVLERHYTAGGFTHVFSRPGFEFPSSKDPTWAQRYPGRATMEIVAPVSYAWFEEWQNSKWMKRGEGYEQLKAKFQQRLLDVLYARFPQAKGHVKHVELSTPLSARTFAAHPHGELYGLAASPERFQARIRCRTPIGGLYLTGADVAMGGVCGALAGGVCTAAAILGVKVLTQLLTRKKKKP